MEQAHDHAAVRRRFRAARTIVALMLRDLSTSHGRTALGYLWELLNPILAIAVLTVLFQLLGRHPDIGTSFALFYATGVLPFHVFTGMSAKMSTVLIGSRSLLAYPGVTYMDAIIARLLLSALTDIVIIGAVVAGIILYERIDTIIDFPVVLDAFTMAVALGLGIGLSNSFLMAVSPTWGRAWTLVTRPLFLLSCIFYTFDSVPLPFRDWLWFNPLIHVIGLMRRGIYSTYDAAYVTPLYVYSIALATLVFGLAMLRRYTSFILHDG